MQGFVTVKVDSRLVQQRLATLRAVVGRPDRVTRAIRETLERRVLERFATKTDPDGNVWDDWSERTKAQRRKVGGVAYKSGPVSLLEHTGAMKRSFFARTTGGTVHAGFGVSYAHFHEKGIPKKMPPRRVLTDGKGGLSRGDRVAVGLAVRRAMEQTLDAYLKS